jgi:membrane protein
MAKFFSDLKAIWELDALKRVGRKILYDDCFGLAGQMAYFVLFSLFPFLMFLVAWTGFVVDDPEAALNTLTESMQGLLPGDTVALLERYIDRTLREAGAGVLFIGILAALWSGSAASYALIKAANRAYEVRETRPLWTIWAISVLMVLLFALLIGILSLVILSPETGGYLQRLIGLPDFFLPLWDILRWVVAFVAVTLVHDVFYYVAPNVDLPFKWVTPGGLTATALILIASVALSFYVGNLGRYDQLYGQLGAVIVLMLWLYVTGFMVILGLEMNAMLARMVEEQRDTRIFQPEGPANDDS